MAPARWSEIIRHVRLLAGDALPHHATDGELLRMWLSQRDQAVFCELVRRHGPMVLSVCRRVLPHEQDAEDAFQATFLLLARRAVSVRRQESLASWLHGVAYRMACDARRAAARRRRHENQRASVPPPDPARTAAWREIQAIIDEEVRRLPERYRETFVLCCLEGLSCADAAQQLGVKEGTVWSRVAWARERLRQRLSRRGVSMTAVFAAAAVCGNTAQAGVPTTLLAATARAASGVAEGTPLSSLCPASVAALVEGMGNTLRLHRLVLGAMVLLLVGMGTGLGLLARQSGPGAPPPLNAKDPQAKAADATIAGRWVVQDHNDRAVGDQIPPDLWLPNATVLITADKVLVNPGRLDQKRILYRLDASRSPHELDLPLNPGTDDKSVRVGIASVTGDTLKVCFARDGKDRPAGFEKAPGNRSYVLKRQVQQDEPLPANTLARMGHARLMHNSIVTGVAFSP